MLLDAPAAHFCVDETDSSACWNLTASGVKPDLSDLCLSDTFPQSITSESVRRMLIAGASLEDVSSDTSRPEESWPPKSSSCERPDWEDSTDAPFRALLLEDSASYSAWFGRHLAECAILRQSQVACADFAGIHLPIHFARSLTDVAAKPLENLTAHSATISTPNVLYDLLLASAREAEGSLLRSLTQRPEFWITDRNESFHSARRAMNLVEATISGTIDEAGIGLFRYFTDVLRDKSFSSCNELLSRLDVVHTDTSLLVAVLSGTAKMPRGPLSARPSLFDRIFEKYKREHGEVDALRALGPFR